MYDAGIQRFLNAFVNEMSGTRDPRPAWLALMRARQRDEWFAAPMTAAPTLRPCALASEPSAVISANPRAASADEKLATV
jgi:hypothetical protein